MKAIVNPLQAYPAACHFLNNNYFKKSRLLFICSCIFFSLNGICQTNNYFGNGGILNGAVWSTNPAGPYTSSLNTTGGAIINFENAATVTGATITVSGINATADVSSWAGAGTLGTGGTIAAINVATGVTLNMNTQSISIAAGTGFIKSGAGVLAMSTGSAYGGGFTLNAGSIIVGGINALGNGSLTLNGGIIASDANMNLSGKYPGGIFIGGNIQFGDLTGLANSTANLTFNNDIFLGASNRILTLGNAGTVILNGVINGSGGISFTANANGSGLIDITNTANLFTGPVNINGGRIRFAADGSFGNTSNAIVLDGGQLLNGSSFAIANTHPIQLGTTAGTGITVASGSFTIYAVITDKTTNGGFTKYGAGVLVLNNSNTYTGTTYIDIAGGTLQLNKAGGATLPSTNNIVQNGGSLIISSNQTLNNYSLVGGNLTVENGVTLTINGVLDYFQPAAITLIGTGKIAYGPAGTLKYSGSIAKTISAVEFPANGGPAIVVCNNSNGISLPFNRSIPGSLNLVAGTFNIGAGALLQLDGASLIAGGGFLAGDAINGATSDLTVSGTTGGTVILPTNNTSIGLRNLTVAGTRTVALNGINDLHLSGGFSIAATAAFDNGGESQLISGGGAPSITIAGKFINRDQHNFTGTNGAIPGISPVLSAGSVIEYGLANGNPQTVTARADYSNLVLSGSGTKTPSNAFSPNGTITITGNAVFDCTANNIGNINTNLTMDGGRLIVGTGGTQPSMDGLYQLTGGVVEFAGTTAKTIRSQTYQNIEITGTNVGNSGGNIILKNLGSFSVKTGGVFTINDNNITGPSGTQTVTVENGAVFNCGNSKGFNGFLPTLVDNSAIHPNIEFINLLTGSTVNYSRDNDQQITVANGLVYQHLTISGNAGIKMAPSATLTVMGNLVKTGGSSFAHNNGTMVFNNTTAIQSFSNTGATAFNCYDFTNSNSFGTGLTILSNLGIENTLNLSANSKLALASGDIHLLSSTAGTAYVTAVPATASISYLTGRFTVERYFPGDRSWRMVTCPLSSLGSTETIFSNWQNNGVYTPGKGTLITGNLPGAGNGLDDSFYDNYSMKKFENNDYVNVANTLVPLSKGLSLAGDNIGYFMFVRGDRNPVNTIFPNTNSTTLSGRGKLQTGPQTMPGLARTGAGRFFALVGNPYASPVNFNSLTRNNLLKRFIVWDPKINQVGAFVQFDDFDNDNIYSQSVASPGGQDLNIQSGQAFFVETDALAGPSDLTFDENNKSVINNPGMFKPVQPLAQTAVFRSTLNIVHADKSISIADGNLAEFNANYHDTIDYQDALKFTNIHESFSLQRNLQSIAMERRPLIQGGDTLFFKLANTSARQYEFLFETANLDPLLTAMLEDSYTRQKTPLNISSASTYHFAINDDPASAVMDRFRVVFKLAGGGALPIHFKQLKAYRQAKNIRVEWVVENAQNIRKYLVEKSADGQLFATINTTYAYSGNGNSKAYSWADSNALAGNNFYRIRSIGRGGESELSEVVFVKLDEVAGGIRIYPNPVSNGNFSLEINSPITGKYGVRVINSLGQIIWTNTFNYTGGILVANISPAGFLVPGLYQLQLTKPGNSIKMFKLIKE